jgi:uncharacterized protein YhaN
MRVLRRAPAPEAESAPALSAEQARSLLDRYQRFLALRPRADTEARLRTQVADAATDLDAAERQLTALLATADIVTGDLNEGLRAFEEAARRHAQYVTALTRSEEATGRLQAALGDYSREQIEERLASCRTSLADLLAEHPDLAAAETDRPFDALKRERERLQEELQAARVEESRLDQEVRMTLQAAGPLAELEEEAARWEAEVARLERARKALAMAGEEIQNAMDQVYRDFAPAVNTFLTRGIEYVTEGRYERARVDPATLKVSLLVPETGQVITDPPVSHGTRAMVYVLMRIGLAQHMSTIGEPVPLVLDDPFVDVDARRLPRMMRFLLELSEQMQVLFFTKEEAVVRWLEAEASGREHSLHNLTQTQLTPTLL